MQNPRNDTQQYDALWRDLWANTHAGGPLARTRYRLALQWLGFRRDSTQRVLDVGAGNGAFIARALKQAPSLAIYGAEFSQAAIDIAHPDIRTRIARCDLQGPTPLPWGGNFDVITCMEVLEHLPDDALAMRHIVQALRPGGRLLVTVPAWESRWSSQDDTAGHVRRYEPEIMRNLIERAGLRTIRMQCWGGPMAWIYMRMIERVGPENVMKVQPTGGAGLVAGLIYHALKMDDLLSLKHGEQLLVLAEKGP